MSFHDVPNRPWKEIVPGVRMRNFWGAHMMTLHVHMEAGAVVPMHSHPHEQAGTVVNGRIEFIVDGETRTLQSGDSYIIPGDVLHSAVAQEESTLFEVFSPVREEYKY